MLPELMWWSWGTFVFQSLQELNPQMYRELVADGTLHWWVFDTARAAGDTYRSLTHDADPMRRAEAREVVMAQVREEIEPPPAPEPEEPTMGEMMWLLRSVLAPERGIPPSPWDPDQR